jgi:hypothetical protein
MEVYDPKRGHYVEDSSLEKTALDLFGGSKVDDLEETVTVEGESREATGVVLDPDSPVFEKVAVGEVDMGSRKNWIFVDIDQVEGEELTEILHDSDVDLSESAPLKNRFITEVTGYEVSDLADKVKETTRGYDSLSEL